MDDMSARWVEWWKGAPLADIYRSETGSAVDPTKLMNPQPPSWIWACSTMIKFLPGNISATRMSLIHVIKPLLDESRAVQANEPCELSAQVKLCLTNSAASSAMLTFSTSHRLRSHEKYVAGVSTEPIYYWQSKSISE